MDIIQSIMKDIANHNGLRGREEMKFLWADTLGEIRGA